MACNSTGIPSFSSLISVIKQKMEFLRERINMQNDDSLSSNTAKFTTKTCNENQRCLVYASQRALTFMTKGTQMTFRTYYSPLLNQEQWWTCGAQNQSKYYFLSILSIFSHWTNQTISKFVFGTIYFIFKKLLSEVQSKSWTIHRALKY